MEQIYISCEMKWTLPDVQSFINDQGQEECFVGMQENSQMAQNVMEVAGSTYKYTMLFAPFLVLVSIIALLFSIYKSIKKKENRWKWIMISIMLFVLIVLSIVLLTILHYWQILAPWIYG